jgi:hypothetical protein
MVAGKLKWDLDFDDCSRRSRKTHHGLACSDRGLSRVRRAGQNSARAWQGLSKLTIISELK